MQISDQKPETQKRRHDQQICCLLSKQSCEMKRSRPYYQSFTSVENQKLCEKREIVERERVQSGPAVSRASAEREERSAGPGSLIMKGATE